MDTKNFNYLDKFIAFLRLVKVNKYVENDDVVIDFGCGKQAYFLNSIKDKIKTGIGLDYEVEDLKDDNIELKKYEFETNLPLKDECYSKIFMLAVLEHIQEDKIDILFKEFRRILKPGGVIVLTTPTPQSKFILELLAYKLKIISEAEIRDHKKYYSKNDLIDLAKINKMKVIGYQTFQFGLNSLCVIKKNK